MFIASAALRVAAASGALGCALLAAPLPAAATPDTDCADYPTRAAAQAAFLAHGGSPAFNWNGLDNDHDGQACEHHQFPGQPTPPPNPGPSGCAVCTPSPQPSPSPEPSPSGPPVGPPPVNPPAPPVPTLPITGPGSENLALAGIGVSLLLVGVGLMGLFRRRA